VSVERLEGVYSLLKEESDELDGEEECSITAKSIQNEIGEIQFGAIVWTVASSSQLSLLFNLLVIQCPICLEPFEPDITTIDTWNNH
jgi:hypothetical protein